jgi:hypothetical protein
MYLRGNEKAVGAALAKRDVTLTMFEKGVFMANLQSGETPED